MINESATLHAGRDIVVTAGHNPLTQENSLIDVYAIVTARCAGLFEFPGASHTSDLTASASVEIDSDSSIISDLDVEIGAIPGINNATWYTLKVWNGLQTDIDSDAGTVTETGLATIDGSIVAGNASTLDVSISEDKSWTINGSQPSFNLDDQAGLVTLSPQSFDDPAGTPPTPFLPFKAGYNSAYEPQQLLNGLDETSKALLAPDISTETVDSITLAGLTAVGGQVVIDAKELAGAATISANVPEITVTNDSDAYLLLDGMGIPNTLNVGQINYGDLHIPTGMTLNPYANASNVEPKQSAISIKQNYDQEIPGSAAGPAIALNDAMFNTAGKVTIYNAEGAFVQKAPINALSVSIDTPNSAYIVSTPDKYFGTSGSIADSFTKSNSVNVQDGSFESTSTTDSPNYIYRPTSTDWTFIGDSGVSANGTGFTSANPDAPYGTQVAFVQETGVIKQAVGGLINGRSYELQFDAARRANYPEPTLQVAMGSTVLATISVDETAYDRHSYPVPTQQPEGTDTLMLTDGFGSTASANWHVEPIAIPDSGTFTVEFNYQASGNRAADGIALVFQQEGVEAVGGIGSDLGYVGIVGPTTAYQMNLYDYEGSHIPGTNFVTGNTSGSYNTTGDIQLTSGNEIRVTLVYDADASTMTETLTYTSDPSVTYTHEYSEVDLGAILGTQAYLGFTGADGGDNSVQEVSGFSLTMGEDNFLEGFDGWSIAGTRFLTFSGIDPDGTDQTVFLDGVTIVDNPKLFTPGLVPASVSYDANHAATTAANILYGEMSGETTSAAFSHWLYNTGEISIDDFVNTDQIWPSDGGGYPSKAKDNWNSTENGSGIIFFGSEIPYLYNALTTVSSGSEFLTQGYLGYLDTNNNARTYSQDASASGNSYTTYLNVTQGTGPQNTSGPGGRGFFPTVPYSDSTGGDFPSSAVITDPQANSLGGSGITAGSLDVNALYLDINGPVDIGSIQQDLSVELSANLQSAAEAYQLDYESGAESSPNMPLDSYLGSSGLTGYYDAQADQIVIDPYSVNGGTTTAVFRGQIISTTQFGKISLHSNPGDLEIDNQTDIPLVLQGITASTDEVMGSVTFSDTLTGTSTTYLYQADDQVSIYQGELDAELDDMTLFAAANGDSVTYDPAPNLAYQWKQDAYISRELKFTNDSENYTLDSTINDTWSWGPLDNSDGSANPTKSTSPFGSQHGAPTTLYLTEGVFNTATAVWYQEPISIPSTGSTTVEFTYQSGGDKAADGIAFAFQTEGVQAIGNAGGYLGYEGISGPTAAYQINIYDCCDPVIPGSNFVTGNTTQNYLSTDPVQFQSGKPIKVKLVFDADNKMVTETLYDPPDATDAQYQRQYPNVDLASVFGSQQVYVGFTGADGGAKSTQWVSDFSLTESDGNSLEGFGSWVSPSQGQGSVLQLDTAITDFSEVATAIITELETATTKFASDNEDAWNYGPSTQWDWTYPTEILLRINNQIPASNSISIDFSNVKYGSLAVTSQSELQLEGNVVFPGSVTLSALNDITQTDGAVVRAQQVDFVSTSGSVGVSGGPVQIDLNPSLPVDATAFQSIYLSSSGDFVIGQIDASVGNSQRPLGNVELQSQGDFIAGSTEAEITASSIDLQAKSGSIGLQSAPLTIQTQAFQIDTGSLVEGLLTAAAQDSIFLVQPRDELRVHSVTTSSPQGVVSLVNQDGDIISGSTRDLFGFGGKKFTSAQITLIDEAIKVRDFVLDSGSLTIAAFEGSVQSNYLQYWTLVGLTPTTQLGSYDQQAGEFVLNSNGLAYYQTQADLYYTALAADQSPVTATSAQVQAYGNLIYSNAVSVFASDLAFGPEWSSLDQFGAYDETYEFAASSQTVSELTHDVDELAQSFSLLSFDAFHMSERGYGGTGSQPAIQTTVLSLSANGSIGALSDPVEITLANMEAGPITSSEQRLLAQATSAGEIKMVGENVDGSRVVYSYEDAPVNVTPVAALIRIDSPLYVDIASEGLVMVDAAGPVNLSETAGDLNLLDIQTLDVAQLVAQNNINQVQLQETSQSTGWSISGDGTLGYVNDDLDYEATDFTLNNRDFATGVIANGSFEEPVQLSESFTYNPASTT
ncbi:MAG: lectin-like domain-containing protein, partial [Pirellulales bacterium]